jgi:hypothetical protein
MTPIDLKKTILLTPRGECVSSSRRNQRGAEPLLFVDLTRLRSDYSGIIETPN